MQKHSSLKKLQSDNGVTTPLKSGKLSFTNVNPKLEERTKQIKQVYNSLEDLFSAFSILPFRRKSLDIDDNKIPEILLGNCFNCQEKFFNFILNKIVCKICKYPFCKECCKKEIKGNYWKSTEIFKVCEYCYDLYSNIEENVVLVKNNKRLTKFDYYISMYDADTPNCLSIFEQFTKETHMYQEKIQSLYDFISETIVLKVFEADKIQKKWQQQIADAIMSVINLVQPSFQDLNDSLDINDYVIVKTLINRNRKFNSYNDDDDEVEDYSELEITKINGYCLVKNINYKKIPQPIKSPKILIFDCSLEFNRCLYFSVTNIKSFIEVEDAFFNNLVGKLKNKKPDIIIVNGKVPLKLKELIYANISKDIIFLTNIESKSLCKLARFTKTMVLTTPDLLNNEFILGKCETFSIQKINLYNSRIKNNQNNTHLIIFDGCDSILGCTFLFFSNNIYLKELEKTFKKLLIILKNLYFTKFLLYYFNCNIKFDDFLLQLIDEEPIYQGDPFDCDNSNNLLNEKVNNKTNPLNRESCINLKTLNSFNFTVAKEKESINNTSQMFFMNTNKVYFSQQYIKTKSYLTKYDNDNISNALGFYYFLSQIEQRESNSIYKGFDKNILSEDDKKLKLTRLVIVLGQDNLPNKSDYVEEVSPKILSESQILKVIKTMCGEPTYMKLEYYSNDILKDKPLGKLIVDMISEIKKKCTICKKAQENHIYYINKKLGRIKISYINKDNLLNENDWKFYNYHCLIENKMIAEFDNKEIGYKTNIFSYGVCRHICNSGIKDIEGNKNDELACNSKCYNCYNKLVTPVVKISREIFNMSTAQYFKLFLYDNETTNRSENLSPNKIESLFEGNNFISYTCNHIVNHDIDRIFFTNQGGIRLQYEKNNIYMIETCLLRENLDFQHYSSLLQYFISRSKSLITESCYQIKHNCKGLFREVMEQQRVLSSLSINKFNNLINIQDLLDIVENFCKFIDKIEQRNSEVEKFFLSAISSSLRFDDYIKFFLFKKKIFFRLVQNNLRLVSITKLINSMEEIIKISSNYTMYLEENEEMSIEADTDNTRKQTTNIPLSISPSPSFIVKSIKSLPFVNIDQNLSYQEILSCIDCLDEYHKTATADVQGDDLSSIIAFSLTSDKYKDYMNQFSRDNKVKLVEIRIERQKENIQCSKKGETTNNIKSNSLNNSGIENDNEELNDIDSNLDNYVKAVEDWNIISLCYDSSKNQYYIGSTQLDSDMINNQLETEIICDDTTPFVMSISNVNLLNRLKSWSADLEMPSSSIKRSMNKKLTNLITLSEINNTLKPSHLNQEQKPQKNELNDTKKKEHKNNNQSIDNSTNDKKIVNAFDSNTNILINLQTSSNLFSSSSNVVKANSQSNIVASLNNNSQDLISFNNKLQMLNIEADFKWVEEKQSKLSKIKNIIVNKISSKTKISNLEINEIEVGTDNVCKPLDIEITCYFPRQFEALRIAYCSSYENFILSVAYSFEWDSVSGGKSNCKFYKCHDNRYILKSVSKREFKMFIESANQYFHHIAKYLFHKMPSALAKILGAYKIKKNENEKDYILLMENIFFAKDIEEPLFYSDDSNLCILKKAKYECHSKLNSNDRFTVDKKKDKKHIKIKAYDLKGSSANRYINNKNDKDWSVLLDTNFKEDFKGEPILLENRTAKLLQAAIHNDTLLLSKMSVVDYSLLLIIDDISLDFEEKLTNFNIKTIRVGIIDYIRKYTWDKQLENLGKTIIHRKAPTIVNPSSYRDRFIDAMNSYFIGI